MLRKLEISSGRVGLWLMCTFTFYLILKDQVIIVIRASDISRKKTQNFVGFSGANSRKNRPISREKSQNLRKNWPISSDFRGKKSKFAEKSADFAGEKSKFAGKSTDFAAF